MIKIYSEHNKLLTQLAVVALQDKTAQHLNWMTIITLIPLT